MTLAIDNKSTICTKDFASVIWNCIDSLLSWHLTLVLPSLACLVYKHLIQYCLFWTMWWFSPNWPWWMRVAVQEVWMLRRCESVSVRRKQKQRGPASIFSHSVPLRLTSIGPYWPRLSKAIFSPLVIVRANRLDGTIVYWGLCLLLEGCLTNYEYSGK